jgi:hypothetical protein
LFTREGGEREKRGMVVGMGGGRGREKEERDRGEQETRESEYERERASERASERAKSSYTCSNEKQRETTARGGGVTSEQVSE